MIIVIMGVSGCGKTTIGQKLADVLGIPFYDADHFHSQENIDKMSSGLALTDEDREPWLNTLANHMLVWQDAVLACSALKESYRKLLASKVKNIQWVYLHGTKELIMQRMNGRKGHYMKPELLSSQLEILEAPAYGYHISIEQDPDRIITDLTNQLTHE